MRSQLFCSTCRLGAIRLGVDKRYFAMSVPRAAATSKSGRPQKGPAAVGPVAPKLPLGQSGSTGVKTTTHNQRRPMASPKQLSRATKHRLDAPAGRTGDEPAKEGLILSGASANLLQYLKRGENGNTALQSDSEKRDQLESKTKTRVEGKNRISDEMRKPSRTLQSKSTLDPSWQNMIQQGQRIKFIGIDIATALTKIFTSNVPHCRTPYFIIRTFRAALLPPRPAPPFPSDMLNAVRRKHPCVYLAVITSKNNISKLAVERNRVRRRFRAALDNVVNSNEGWKLVSPEYVYVVSPNAALFEAPYKVLVEEVERALRHVKERRRERMQVATLPWPNYMSSSVSGKKS
ncbi:ribonuclease P protein component [Cryptococcus depauperatus CBS 7841]|uniref:Ribonuclease P protein component n=1 Tax=Cryptococcus depauperatus CBS 7841 TaxID=1295531 RepID=A0AAJ8LZ15_9TREE